MSFFVASALLTSTASFLLAIFVYFKGPKKAINQTLALFSLVLAIWTFAQAMTGIVEEKEIVIIWARVQLGAAVFLTPFFLHFVFSLLGKTQENKNILWFSYLLALVLLALDFTPLFVNDVRAIEGFRYYPTLTPVYAVFAVWLVTSFIYGLGQLIFALRQASGEQYKKILYVFVASLIGFLGGGTSFFPIFKINLPIVSHFSMPLYVAVAVYAIVRHKLIDITVYVRKGLIYSIITVFFTSLYVILILLANNFFAARTEYNSIIVTALVVFSLALFFQPLRDRVQDFINQMFFKSQYDYQETIKKISRELSAVLKIEGLIDLVQRIVADILKPKRSEICLGEAKPSFVPRLSVAIKSKGLILGQLYLDQKLSGDEYSTQDKNLLDTLAHQVGVALENIHLHQGLVRSESLAALGTMAAGMAHEIKNPLASIKGMTQVLPENMEDKEFIKDFTDLVPRQLDRINKIVENLLKVGKKIKLEKKNINLVNLVNEVLDFYANLCRKKGIEVKRNLDQLPEIYADPEQLQQVFTNLVLNSVQAMPEGGVLEVTGEQGRGRLVIQVSDTGVGIPSDKLEKIFDPFFTLKEEGSGLGLFTAFRVLQEHGGAIEVESQVGKGTKFTLWLPIKPKQSV